MPVDTSHVSVVQALVSSQSASPVQHSGTAVRTQRFVVVLQVSVVQRFASSQSASDSQQSVIGLS